MCQTEGRSKHKSEARLKREWELRKHKPAKDFLPKSTTSLQAASLPCLPN